MSQKVSWTQKIAPELARSRDRLGLERKDNYRKIIVELSGTDTDEIISIIYANHGKLDRKTNIPSALVAEVPSSAIPFLAESKQVKKIWPDNQIKICRK